MWFVITSGLTTGLVDCDSDMVVVNPIKCKDGPLRGKLAVEQVDRWLAPFSSGNHTRLVIKAQGGTQVVETRGWLMIGPDKAPG